VRIETDFQGIVLGWASCIYTLDHLQGPDLGLWLPDEDPRDLRRVVECSRHFPPSLPWSLYYRDVSTPILIAIRCVLLSLLLLRIDYLSKELTDPPSFNWYHSTVDEATLLGK
jgi:hypothetical protein